MPLAREQLESYKVAVLIQGPSVQLFIQRLMFLKNTYKKDYIVVDLWGGVAECVAGSRWE